MNKIELVAKIVSIIFEPWNIISPARIAEIILANWPEDSERVLDLKRKLETANTQLSERITEVEELESKLSKAEGGLNLQASEIYRLKGDNETLNDVLSELNKTLETKLIDLSKYDGPRQKILKLILEASIRNNQFTEFRHQLELARKDADHWHNAFNSGKVKRDELEAEIATACAERDEWKEKYNIEYNAVESNQRIIFDLMKERDTFVEQSNLWESKCTSQIKDIDELREHVENATREANLYVR